MHAAQQDPPPVMAVSITRTSNTTTKSLSQSPAKAAASAPSRPASRNENDLKCETNEHSDDGSATSSTRPPMKNVSRERMKAETTFLRARVQELERELSQTLAHKALARCQTPSPVWRDLAKRQAARREKSELDRDRLRARLLHQIQVAKSLETIFRNRSGHFIEDLYTSESGHAPYPIDDLTKLHDRFMDEIDQHYPLVDIIFADPVAASTDAMEMRRSTVVSQQTNGDEKLYVELRNAVYVPFAYARVCDAMWRAITNEYSRQQRLVELYRCTDDEYTVTFLSQKNAPGSGHRYHSSTVMRRFTEADRTVLVWRSVNWDQARSTNREYGDETGWITVSPAVDSVTGERASEGAIVRICTRYIPIWELQAKLIEAGALTMAIKPKRSSGDNAVGEMTAQSLEVGEVTNRILNGTEEDIAAITESIENILLDESLGSADGDLESMIDDLVAMPSGSLHQQHSPPLLPDETLKDLAH